MNNLINDIFNYDCEILDIEKRQGQTGYIDFIKQNEVLTDVAKGCDIHNRNFIVFKAKFIYISNNEEKCFSTFFKRYIDIPLYHICGHDGKLLMQTVGGMTIEQAELIKKLLYEKVVDINLDMIINLKLNCYPFSSFTLSKDDAIDETKIPYQIKLGY
jgi:hypothetical protein